MIYRNEITIWTKKYNEMIKLLPYIEESIAKCGIENGMITVLSNHTTTGIMVNEGLECLEKDISQFLEKLIPEQTPYNHARMLKSYGSTAGNATGHLKSHITGNHCHLVLWNGMLVKGDAQELYLCEFDGPAKRTVQVLINGE